jgi:hypothetical protein
MSNNVNAPENLRVRPSKFKSELSFNEWAEKLNVSRGYVPPTPYFTGNAKSEYVGYTESKDPILSRIAQSLAELVKSIPTPF